MIVDCRNYIWNDKAQLGLLAEPLGEVDASVLAAEQALEQADAAVILACVSAALGLNISNEFVAELVGTHGRGRWIGFASVDPTRQHPYRTLEHAVEKLGLRGVAVSPAAQGFHPADTRAMQLYEAAEEFGVPVFFDLSPAPHPQVRISYARPELLEDVARQMPKLQIVVAEMARPWVSQAVLLLRNHANVYAELSGLVGQPWSLYQALLEAYQAGVMDKLLLGGGFPFGSTSAAIEQLYLVNQFARQSPLPAVPRQLISEIVNRDALSVLHLAQPDDPVGGAREL